MTKDQIKTSIETGVLKLGTWNKFTHYGIVLFAFSIPCTFSFIYLINFLEGSTRSLKEGEIWFSIIPLLLGIIFYRIQKNRLKFKSIRTNLSRSQINEIIAKVATELEWIPYETNEQVFIAKTRPSFLSGSWGEQITILYDNNRILVNSICDPDKRSSVVSFGRNKQNQSTLIYELSKASG